MITRLTRIAAVGGIVVAGTGVGFLGQRAFGDDGTVTVTASPRRVAVETYRCPKSGPLGPLHSGDRVYITGRGAGADAAWLQIRDPGSPAERRWVPAAALDVDASTDKLPRLRCGEGGGTVDAPPATRAAGPTTTERDASTTTSSSTTTVPGQTSTTRRGASPPATRRLPATTKPGVTTPGTTAPPVTTAPAPTIGSVKASPTAITEDWKAVCPTAKTTSTITANAAHATSATLRWTLYGGGSGSRAMSRNGATFTGTLGPFPDGTTDGTGHLKVWVTATGPGGSVSSEGSPVPVTLYDCYFG